ncbi:hypothetical protein [Nostoc sp. T09]|nr:hypothetical protein [Nostoc sp. T09]
MVLVLPVSVFLVKFFQDAIALGVGEAIALKKSSSTALLDSFH